jgi:ribosomal protein S18 acetylase RimI-like enzyme
LSDPDLIRSVEKAAMWAWPPVELRSIHGWLLAIGGPGTRRLRSVRTLDFDDGADVGQAIEDAERSLAARGWPGCFHLTDHVAPGNLDALLDRRGYELITPTTVMLAPAAPVAEPDRRIELHTRAGQAVMNAICDRHWTPPSRLERADIFARIRRPHRFALAWHDGEPAGAGLCVRDGDLAGIFAMRTQPRYQRRGIAARLLDRLAGWAADEGATRLYLQVEGDNEPALALYRRAGFASVYGYHYRERALDIESWGE